MAWLTGVVTYSAEKTTKDGKGSYGMLAVEGVSMFCPVEMLVPTGTEVRVFVQGQSRKNDDGSYSNSINGLTVQRVGNSQYVPASNGYHREAEIPF